MLLALLVIVILVVCWFNYKFDVGLRARPEYLAESVSGQFGLSMWGI